MSLRLRLEQFLVSDAKETAERICRFLRDFKEKTNAAVFVVGMSGGLDSSVTAALCALAIGGSKVIGAFLPEKETRNEDSLLDAKLVARKYGIKLEWIDLTDLTRVALETLGSPKEKRNPIPNGNVKARLRAMVLYYLANKNHGVVVGTGDKSEIMLGYFTKFGDGACDVEPLADVYKTSIRALAKHLNLPERVYSKPPSPELWAGQTAAKELGLEYEKLDMILWGLERWIDPETIAREAGIPVRIVRRVRTRWIESEHKRKPPVALKLGYRTAGSDLRLPLSLREH